MHIQPTTCATISPARLTYMGRLGMLAFFIGLTSMMPVRGFAEGNAPVVKVAPGYTLPYRKLAEYALQAFQEGDGEKAATLGRIIEKVWDRAEGLSQPLSLGKEAPETFREIDQAMDAFVKPLQGYKTKKADAATVISAYHNYLKKLDLLQE